MNWTKKLWRTLPIALVIVLATAAVTFAAPPKEVKITGTPTTDYPNPHKRDANVKVNFEYISNPTVLGSTTVEAWLLDHATEEVVASARKEIEDSEPNPFINVTIPTDAPHGQLYDVKVIVRNSDGDSPAVIEKGGTDKKGAVIVDAEAPAKIGWVKMYKEGTPDEEVHSPIDCNNPKFKWAATTDEGSKVEKYFWEVTDKVTAFAGDPTQEGEVDPVEGATEYGCGPVNALDDGTYYFHVRAVDSVGNYSVPQTLKFVVDTTAPALTMEKPALVEETRWATIRPTVEIKAVETGSGLDKASTVFEVLDSADKKVLGAEGWTGMVWTWTPNADLTGCTVYTVKMKVKDMAGNEAQGNWEFKVDKDEPIISGLVPENDTWTNKPLKSDEVTSDYLTISATVADDNAEGCCPSGINYGTAQMWVDGHQIMLSDPNFKRENGLVSYTPTKLRKGRNIPVKVEVKDYAGNMTTAEWHFHYDPDTPELSAESPKTWTNNKRPVVSVKVKQTVSGLDPTEGACTFEVKQDETKVDGTPTWNGDVWEWRPEKDLAECTEYIVTVKVKNRAGTEATKSWKFKVDTQAPKITPVSPLSTDPDDECWLKDSAAKPEIKAKLEDEGCAGINEKTIEMRINGQPVPKYVATEEVDGWEYDEATGTLTYRYHGDNELEDGWYIVTVDVKDNAGNAAKTAEWEFGVDTVKPKFEGGEPEEWVGT
ncbi:MAG TPA: Ig-like domain-containing protein, partial [Firmicutes bacterium]|nr:Ig-like domain-containing protein [Bacillota bacterium]